MPVHVGLWANTLSYPEGGGHLWVYLNWTLGLRANGCEVTWIEAADPTTPATETARFVKLLREKLRRYGIERLAITSETDDPLPSGASDGCVTIDDAARADVLLNFRYSAPRTALARFKRTALIDIDPGLLQVWLSEGQATAERHDLYFTIGETVGKPDAKFSDAGLPWLYTPPCVALDHWTVAPPPAKDAAFTTVSQWSTSKEWVCHRGESYHNDKRSGFVPFFELPKLTRQPLMLAICQAADDKLRLAADEAAEKKKLEKLKWRITHAHSVASTPWDYQNFIRSSRGEFSCVKPSCVRLANAWVSDRTLCYLASGRPAVIQHTGPSQFLPDAAGMWRFRDVADAARCLDTVAADYDRQCRLARTLAEEFFDAKKVTARLLERAMG